MTELVPFVPATDLLAFAEEAAQVHGIAKALATTSFVPKVMQGRPDEITGAILFGREINLPPMVALQNINIIEGKPSLYAQAMRGMAQSAGVKFRLIESTETRCRYAARAPGDDNWTEVSWTYDRAKKLGLVEKSNWKKQPQAMLVARATSEVCRLVAANVFLGMPYSTEELTDGGEGGSWGDPEPVTPEPAKRTVRRNPVPATVPPTVVNPEPAADEQKAIGYDQSDPEKRTMPEAAPERDMVSVPVRKALMARFNDLNITAREDRLREVGRILGREVHSVNQITDIEGKLILDAMRSWSENRDSDSDWPPVPEAAE